MKQHNRTNQIRNCNRKKNFTKDEALIKASEMNRRGHFLNAYCCKICGNWHIGGVRKHIRLRIAFDRLERDRERHKS